MSQSPDTNRWPNILRLATGIVFAATGLLWIYLVVQFWSISWPLTLLLIAVAVAGGSIIVIRERRGIRPPPPAWADPQGQYWLLWQIGFVLLAAVNLIHWVDDGLQQGWNWGSVVWVAVFTLGLILSAANLVGRWRSGRHKR